MILSYHITDRNNLETRSENEHLFSNIVMFSSVEKVVSYSLSSDFDGNYLCLDSRRSKIIRSGAASTGMKKRWKEHLTCSMLNSESDKDSKFYSSYPNMNCKAEDMPSEKTVKGRFQQITQLMGIGFDKRKMSNVLGLFDWSNDEEMHLSSLSMNGGTQDSKKYKHLCYLCELAYALCISPQDNISSNPGCEWQLCYYGGGW